MTDHKNRNAIVSIFLLDKSLLLIGLPCYQFLSIYCRITLHYLLPYIYIYIYVCVWVCVCLCLCVYMRAGVGVYVCLIDIILSLYPFMWYRVFRSNTKHFQAVIWFQVLLFDTKKFKQFYFTLKRKPFEVLPPNIRADEGVLSRNVKCTVPGHQNWNLTIRCSLQKYTVPPFLWGNLTFLCRMQSKYCTWKE